MSLLHGLTALGLAAVMPLAPSPAPQDGLETSHDNVVFTSDAKMPLFTGKDRVIPSSRAASFVYVRNGHQDAGVLSIDLDQVTSTDAKFASAVTISTRIGGEEHRLDLGTALKHQGCSVLFPGYQLKPGQSVKVEASAVVDPRLGQRPGDSGRQGANQRVTFSLNARLVEAQAVSSRQSSTGDACQRPAGAVAAGEHHPAPSAGAVAAGEHEPARLDMEVPPQRGLAFTGAGGALAYLGLGLGVIGGGCAFVIAARRRRAEEEEEGA